MSVFISDGKKGKKSQKGKVSLTASFASTVGEELIVLLRKLHSLPVWNTPINSYIALQLRRVVAMVRDEDVLEVRILAVCGQCFI